MNVHVNRFMIHYEVFLNVSWGEVLLNKCLAAFDEVMVAAG